MRKVLIFAIIIIGLYSSCSIIPPAELPQSKNKFGNKVIIEDFEGMVAGISISPSGTTESFLKGSKMESDGWLVSQGPKDAIKWVVSVVNEGYNSEKSILLDWNNKNQTFLNFAIWFYNPQTFHNGEEISFYAKPLNKVKFDITIRVKSPLDKKDVVFTAQTKRLIATGKWQKVVLPFYKMSVPQWFIKEENGGNPTKIKKVPKNPTITMINISPVWNSKGKCYIDDVVISPLTIKKKKIEYKKREDWYKSKNFVCYYGADAIADMSEFNIAIIESKSHTKKEIELLKKSGTWVVGYVTIGEDDKLEKLDGKGPGGYASFYMDADEDGKPDMNVNWNSYYVNAGSKLWQDIIINKRIKAILDKGCDGIFMDTVDTVEIYPQTKKGMIDLIANIRKKYPDIKIVQNRGFSVIADTAPYIDAVMYEDFSIDYDWQTDTYSKADESKLVSTGIFAVTLNKIRYKYKNGKPTLKKPQFLVVALDYANADQKDLIQFCYDRAWEYDFIPYVSTIQLDEVYPYVKPGTKRGSKMFKGETAKLGMEGKEDFLNKIVIKNVKPVYDKNNFALYKNGTKIKADSAFAGYNPISVIDGFTNDKRLPWQRAAWASLDLFVDHWLEIELPAPKKISKVKIYWAYDNGRYYNSKEVEIQYFFQGYWKKLGVIKTDKDNIPVSVLKLSRPEIGRKIRIYQKKGNGPRIRPNIMWIAEVEIF